MANSVTEAPSCVRCKDPLVMGHAYELGGDRWHTHCFSCYKCDKPLSCDSNFLVLGTGALICYACSDSCRSCGNKIDDLAIILASSNEAYCSDCFKCCKCNAKIDDLRYAKTKRGLFCIACHERLLEKRKNYEERKRRHKKQLPLIPPSGSNLDLNQEESTPSEADLVIPARSNQRPMSPIKNVALQNSVLSRGNTSIDSSPKDHRPLMSSASSLAAPLDFSAVTMANGEVSATGEKQTTSDFTTNNGTIRSNSESVVAQFLLDGGYGSTADEESIKRKHSEAKDSSNSLEEEVREQAVVVKTPQKTHRSQLSIDDMLQHTLENDGYSEIDGQGQEEQNLLSVPKEQKKILLNRTPLRNSKEEYISKSPIAHRQGLVLDDEEIVNALNSPARVESIETSPNSGLGILKKSDSQSADADDKIIGLSYDNVATPDNRSEAANAQESRSSSGFGHQRKTSGGNARKLGRSLSLRSKSIMMNLRPKTKDNNLNGGSEHDTHSGWGVASKPSTDTSPPKERVRAKHPSDSTIYSHGSSGIETTQHKRSTSNTNGGVSVFRTPPLDTQASFSKSVSSHHKNPSLGTTQIVEEDEDSGNTPTNDQFLKKDVWQMELALRRLKLEINQLESTKSQLMNDVDSLKTTKSNLQQEISSLKSEKGVKTSSLEPVDSYERETSDELPDKQAATATVATSGKPRFWKLFSGNRPNGNYANMSNKLDISPPVLQNPNDFSDVKLMPVQNRQRSSVSSPPTKDGDSLYGSTLVARCAYEGHDIPMIVDTCINHIESNEEYLKSDGLYRKSGSQVLIEQIEAEFSQSNTREAPSKALRADLQQDIHAVSGVLKRYLRKLPNPVFSFQIYEPLMALVRDNNLVAALPLRASTSDEYQSLLQDTTAQLRSILELLPQEHYTLLKVLTEHIEKVSRYSDENLMNLHNLSLVFTPGLIRDYSGEKDISDMRERNYVVAFVLANQRLIF
ncbi:LAFA_0D06084g1_1 [Lachancea sp. 'fantastica']|nr:LAFA_0D06084g1_1 [Lachancea sp. 'fantastica']